MTTQIEKRSAHPYVMYELIESQPEAIARVLTREQGGVDEVARMLDGASNVHLVGVGTSWHAALVGEYLLRLVAGRNDARAWHAMEFSSYPPVLSDDDLVIVLSHRGTKRFSASALELAKASGARTALVTGLGSGARAELADVVLRTCEQEGSATFTVSHTTAMTALAMVAAEVGDRAGRAQAAEARRDLARLPDMVREAMSREEDVKKWAVAAKEFKKFYCAGWGPNASTAYELALKMKESSFVAAEGIHVEQYIHGSFAPTGADTMSILIAPPGPGYDRAVSLARAASGVGAYPVALVERGDEEIAGLAPAIHMPPVPEPLSPIIYLVPLQLFSYWLAVERGCNPDLYRRDDPKYAAVQSYYDL